ncbi:hypothetical protein ACFL5K_05555, partial [Gemmatimonadota bacterium]
AGAMHGRPEMGLGQAICGAIFYILLAVWLIWMGIGSIKARRWARALILVFSWLWLVCGIQGLFYTVMFSLKVAEQVMVADGQMPPAMVTVAKVMMTGFMTVFGVIIPGVLVLFYKGKNVKATCEHRDSKIRWTDNNPLPVLALSMILVIGAVSIMASGPFYGWVIPFFGVILSGISGAVVSIVVILLLGYLALGTYKLSLKAWKGVVALIIFWTLSGIITFSRVGLLAIFEKMNFPEQSLEFMKQSVLQNETYLIWYFVLWSVLLLGYLLYIKRFFVPAPASGTAQPGAGTESA